MKARFAFGSRLPTRFVFEAVLILTSVGLGYAAARYEDYRNERALALQALAGLSGEMEYNRSQLEPVIPIHAAWVAALEKTGSPATAVPDRSAIDVYFATRPELPMGSKSAFPALRRSAWDGALSTGAIRLFDYDIAAALSDVYRTQEIASDNVERLAHGALSDVATYDPVSRHAAVRLLWLTLADILSAEITLLDLYDQRVPTLAAVAGR